MKRLKILLVIVSFFSLNSIAQVARMSIQRNHPTESTGMLSDKYFRNFSMIISMMDWIDNTKSGCRDSIYISELNAIYSELETLYKSRMNFSLFDNQITKLDNKIKKSYDDVFQRCSLTCLIKKEILSKKRDEIDQLVLEGLQYNLDDKLDSAYLKFKTAIEKDPTRLNYYCLLIDTEIQLNNNTGKALEYINKVISLKNKTTKLVFDPYIIRCNIYQNQKQFQLAYDDINLILKNDSNDLFALSIRAHLKTELNDFVGSNSDYQTLLKKYKHLPFRVYVDSAEVFNNIGWNYYHLKDYKTCVEYANKSLQLKIKNAYALDTRGSGYFGLGEYEKCISDFTKAIELDPTLSNSYYLRGLSYQKLNKQELAFYALNAALRLGVEEANDVLKELSLSIKTTDIENNQRNLNNKVSTQKHSIRIDPFGIHFFLK